MQVKPKSNFKVDLLIYSANAKKYFLFFKAFPKVFADGIEGVVVHPVIVKL